MSVTELHPPLRKKVLTFCREHPYMVGLLVCSTIAGAVGAAVLPIGESLPMARRVIGGAIAGFYFGLFPLGFRLFE